MRRISRRDGRIPYSFVAVVILASIFLLVASLEQVSIATTTQNAYDVPGATQNALALVESDISSAAQYDLMRSEANLLAGTVNPSLNLLNGSLNTAFTTSMAALGLSSPQGLTEGTVVVKASGWGINATFAEGQVMDGTPAVTLTPGPTNPYLPLPNEVNLAQQTTWSFTTEPIYPMATGHVVLTALDGNSGQTLTQSYSFSVSVQSELGLLEAKAGQFRDALTGPSGSLSELVKYLVTTLGELRALSGYGSGGYPGPTSGTVISGATNNSVLSQSDVRDAVSLAILLDSLRYFRSFDAGAVTSFLSSMPPGAYQQLLEHYVFNGTIDPATLFLLFLDSQGGWSDGWVASGEGLASAIYGFADRFKFDLLQHFWGANVVDPTLTEPVASWSTVQSQGTSYAISMLSQWLWDYGTWLGVTQKSLPAYNNTATIPAMTATVAGCTYVLFPGGSIQTSDPGVPDLASLILGTPYSETITLPNNQQVTLMLAPDNYQIWENVSIDNPGSPYYYAPNYWIDFNENATYITTNQSLLWLFNPQEFSSYDPGAYDRTLHTVMVDLSNSMQHKSATAGLVGDKGYLDYVGYQGDLSGANTTLTGAGLPNLSTPAGRNTALNTSYSFLTNGTTSLFQGPFSRTLANFSQRAANPANVTNWWVNGASHPTLVGPADPPTTDAANNWTMSAISSYAAREWFQMLYTLWYGSGGTVPTTAPAVNQINYQNMDASQYNVVSPGVERAPPAPYQEPNFAINVMNETFYSVYCWITGTGTGIGCGGEDGYQFCPNNQNFFGDCLGATAQDNPNYYYGACGGGNAGLAYNAALNNYYYPGTGGLNNMWNVVRTSVLQSLAGGVDQIHALLQSSWDSVYNNTGDATWGGQNFTQWILQFIAPPILNDTVLLAQAGGWVTQLYNTTERWLSGATNLSGTVVKPWLDRGRPYAFALGNSTLETADAQVFNESLSQMTMSFGGGALTWSLPQYSVHLVDPQNQSTNMGIAPFETSWSISLQGSLSLSLVSSRMSLLSGGTLHPTVLNLSLPVNSQTLVTLYTPWELGSGWDNLPTPLPGDPTLLNTRGLTGLEGHDYHSAPALLPGVYPSVPLDDLLLRTAALGRVTAGEGLSLANLLAGYPGLASGGSAAWSQNLTLLELTTNAGLAATSGTFLTASQTDLALLRSDLSSAAQGGVPLAFDFGANAFLGANATFDTTGQVVSYFWPAPASPTFGPQEEYTLTFQGARVGDAFTIDNPFVVANPGTNGFSGSWGTSAAGTYQLQSLWVEFGQKYMLSLRGPATPAPVTSQTATYPSLSVPYLFGKGGGIPGSVSVFGAGGLPGTATSTFVASLPPPGTTVTFPDYIAQQEYAAGHFYDDLVSGAVPVQAGIGAFGYSTAISQGGSGLANYSLYLTGPSGGVFGSAAAEQNLTAFLLWLDDNMEPVCYSLGAAMPYLSVLSTVPAGLLSPVVRNVTWEWGTGAQPYSDYAFSGANLAALEADLAGSGGGMGNSPTVLIGGGSSGSWGFSGALTG